MQFPIDDDGTTIATNSSAAAIGKNNTVISGKNIIAPGSVIKTGGSFRLGDG